jgi:hypothetical protein
MYLTVYIPPFHLGLHCSNFFNPRKILLAMLQTTCLQLMWLPECSKTFFLEVFHEDKKEVVVWRSQIRVFHNFRMNTWQFHLRLPACEGQNCVEEMGFLSKACPYGWKWVAASVCWGVQSSTFAMMVASFSIFVPEDRHQHLPSWLLCLKFHRAWGTAVSSFPGFSFGL